jgi:hypothetical protein
LVRLFTPAGPNLVATSAETHAVRFDEAQLRVRDNLAFMVDLFGWLNMAILTNYVLILFEEPLSELLPFPVVAAASGTDALSPLRPVI